MRSATAAAIILTGSVILSTTVPGLAQSVTTDAQAAQPIGVIAAPQTVQAEPVAVDATNGESTETVQNSAPQAPVEVVTPPAPVVPAVETPAQPPRVPARASSLAAMVRAVEHREPESAELRCLASGVYFESNGETLDGQLAVAHVIINRSRSGRFASSYCGVLTQRGQFSFVRGGVVPQPPRGASWQRSVAIARIAQENSWANPAPGALFFHAARISPGWNRPRIARIDNHIFYR